MVLEDLRASLELQPEGISPWCPDSPTLYELTIILGEQSEKLHVGFRQTEFTPDRGFLLNGKPIKLHGVFPYVQISIYFNLRAFLRDALH